MVQDQYVMDLADRCTWTRTNSGDALKVGTDGEGVEVVERVAEPSQASMREMTALRLLAHRRTDAEAHLDLSLAELIARAAYDMAGAGSVAAARPWPGRWPRRAALVRIPGQLHDTLSTIGGAAAGLSARLGHPPTIAEIAAETGINPGEVERALQVADEVSIDQPVGEDGAMLGDFIEDLQAEAPADVATRHMLNDAVLEALDDLTPGRRRSCACASASTTARPGRWRKSASSSG